LIVLRKDALFKKKYDQVGSAKLHGFEVLLTKNEIHVRFCLTLFPKSQKISRNRPSTSNFDLVSIFEPDVFKFDLTIYQKSNSEEKTWKIEKRSKTIAFSIPQESKFRTKVPLSICPPQPVQLPPSRMRRSPRSGLNPPHPSGWLGV